jgi:hypothetical protein
VIYNSSTGKITNNFIGHINNMRLSEGESYKERPDDSIEYIGSYRVVNDEWQPLPTVPYASSVGIISGIPKDISFSIQSPILEHFVLEDFNPYTGIMDDSGEIDLSDSDIGVYEILLQGEGYVDSQFQMEIL